MDTINSLRNHQAHPWCNNTTDLTARHAGMVTHCNLPGYNFVLDVHSNVLDVHSNVLEVYSNVTTLQPI